MTISAETAVAGPYSGNGSTTAFAFNFKCFSTSDVDVYLEASTGVQTLQTLTTHYSVSLNADQDASPGGTVTMVTAPASGETLHLASGIPYTRSDVFSNAGGFYPNVLNDARDKTTLQIIQLKDMLNRALLAPVGSSGATLGTETDLETVADNIADIEVVAARVADIAVVAARDTDIGTVAGRDSDIGTVADALDDGTIDDLLDGQVAMVTTYTTLKALAREDGKVVRVTDRATADDGGGGFFVWRAGDYSTQVGNDAEEGVYVLATGVAATSGAWVRMLDGEDVTPEMFGAIKDSSGDAATTETAIQAAIDYVNAQGGGTIRLGEGTYYLGPDTAAHLTLEPKVNLIGRGSGRSIIMHANAVGGHMFQPDNGTDDLGRIEGLTLDGNVSNIGGGTTGGAGVRAIGCSNLALRDVVSKNHSGYGLGFQADSSGGVQNKDFHIERVVCHTNGQDGIDGKDMYRSVFRDIRCYSNTSRGLDVRGRRCTYDNVKAYSNGSTGISLRTWGEVTAFTDSVTQVTNCEAYDNTEDGFYLDSNEGALTGAQGHYHVTNCEARDNGGSGFLIKSAESATPLFVKLTNCKAFSNDDDGYEINGELNAELHNCDAIDNTRYGLTNQGNGFAKVFGGVIDDNGSYNIYATDTLECYGVTVKDGGVTQNILLASGAVDCKLIDCDVSGTTRNIQANSGADRLTVRGGRWTTSGVYNFHISSDECMIDMVRHVVTAANGATSGSRSVLINTGATDNYVIDSIIDEITIGALLNDLGTGTTSRAL